MISLAVLIQTFGHFYIKLRMSKDLTNSRWIKLNLECNCLNLKEFLSKSMKESQGSVAPNFKNFHKLLPFILHEQKLKIGKKNYFQFKINYKIMATKSRATDSGNALFNR
ncbi:hypothetical protein HZS_2782 [Henneguya salminicola]|nr:hypothetical protein HZS_2782 [Henneguya salminicola]